jgi:anti-sigma regulatory factor (Ser/Thr protein kinase)
MLYRSRTNQYEVISSRNLPLGVLPSSSFNSETTRVSLEFGDRILMWSDGIFEARNEHGDMYGEERLHALMEMHKGSDELFRIMLDRVHEYIGDTEKDDDISLIEIPFVDRSYESKFAEKKGENKEKLADWAMDFSIQASSLRQFDPLPTVTGILNEVSGLVPHRSTIYTIVSELYSNALDHGVLGLNSTLKKTPAGFTEYYELRREKLQALEQGLVRFSFHHTQSYDQQGELTGRLTIRVRDSGPGFGVEEDLRSMKTDASLPPEDPDENRYFGRGLTLIRAVCESVLIRAPGNDVEVHFVWHESDR